MTVATEFRVIMNITNNISSYIFDQLEFLGKGNQVRARKLKTVFA